MKKRELSELRKLDNKELTKKLDELTKKHIETQVKIASKEETNLKIAKHLKSDIAQINTIIREAKKEIK
jgi:ribosomal protein L29